MTPYDIAKFYGYNSVEEYYEAEKRNNEIFFGDLKEQKPSKCIPHGILSPEEQELQDTMDKIITEISSQLGIPKWKAESAVKAVIKEFGEKRNYVVYKPTPLGTGIIFAVFVSEYAAKQFISHIAGEYAIAEVEVNGSTSIRGYMDLIKENADE